MTDINYYQPLITTNEAEQNTLGKIQAAFKSAITSSNSSQNTMISSYMSANASRKACYAECPKGGSTDTTTWKSEVKKDAAGTTAGPATIPAATSCSGYDCSIEGQFCPKGSVGASDGNYICTNKKWVKTDSRPATAIIADATSCSGYDCSIEGQFCPKGSVGASAGNYICTNKKWVKTDSRPATAAEATGLKDVIASCKAGCDLKWPGIVQNKTRSQGVNVGKTVGRYKGTDGKEHDIGQCIDLAKYAPKVKLGGLCDANEECESVVCINWGSSCANSGETLTGSNGRCGLGLTRVDGSNYAWEVHLDLYVKVM